MSISVESRITGLSRNKADPKKPAYNRNTQLPKLIGLWPGEIANITQEKIVGLLQKALRAERRRGQAGHWTYDLNRHIALAESLREEEQTLRAQTRNQKKPQPINIRLKKQNPANSRLSIPAISPLQQLSLNSLRKSRNILAGL